MDKVSGKSLAREHGLFVDHALYRNTGDWFHVLKSFPGALLDAKGYLRFATQEAYDDFIAKGSERGIHQNVETNTLTVRGGIAGHEEYMLFEDAFLSVAENEAGGKLVTEGACRQVTVSTYERDASARRRCIHKWGLTCRVCGFNFAKCYGKIGVGFIHVHHLVPVASFQAEYVLDPENDLRPVCANCHAMLHRRQPPFSIDELRSRLRKT